MHDSSTRCDSSSKPAAANDGAARAVAAARIDLTSSVKSKAMCARRQGARISELSASRSRSVQGRAAASANAVARTRAHAFAHAAPRKTS
jgi:hypothetical protein